MEVTFFFLTFFIIITSKKKKEVLFILNYSLNRIGTLMTTIIASYLNVLESLESNDNNIFEACQDLLEDIDDGDVLVTTDTITEKVVKTLVSTCSREGVHSALKEVACLCLEKVTSTAVKDITKIKDFVVVSGVSEALFEPCMKILRPLCNTITNCCRSDLNDPQEEATRRKIQLTNEGVLDRLCILIQVEQVHQNHLIMESLCLLLSSMVTVSINAQSFSSRKSLDSFISYSVLHFKLILKHPLLATAICGVANGIASFTQPTEMIGVLINATVIEMVSLKPLCRRLALIALSALEMMTQKSADFRNTLLRHDDFSVMLLSLEFNCRDKLIQKSLHFFFFFFLRLLQHGRQH